MIQGIGIDIEDVAKIEEKIRRNEAFKVRIFSENEIAYCESKKYPSMHYAVRWAAKEAFLKAFGIEFIGNHHFHEIEIENNEHGKPFLKLSGKSLQTFQEKKYTQIHISLSHTNTQAIAYIIIEK